MHGNLIYTRDYIKQYKAISYQKMKMAKINFLGLMAFSSTMEIILYKQQYKSHHLTVYKVYGLSFNFGVLSDNANLSGIIE